MSKSTDYVSLGAVPKTVRINNKRCKKNKNKYIDLEMETGDVPLREQAAGPPASLPSEGTRCKKRNKGITFALEGEGTSKKPKREDTTPKIHVSRVFKNSHLMWLNMNRMLKDGIDQVDEMVASTSRDTVSAPKIRKLSFPAKAEQGKRDTAVDLVSNTEIDNTPHKRKDPKRPKNPTASTEMETCDEHTSKLRNEAVSEDDLMFELGNLNLDPDQNNLANLFDDMKPASPKPKAGKASKLPESTVQTDINSNVPNVFNLKKVVKWTKKRWNKDRKGASVVSDQQTAIVIKNLPLALSSVYRKKLADVFGEFGSIKRIGPAEMRPEADGPAIFNTTIYFETEESAIKALELDNHSFCGSAIRVVRPLPPTETTAVARCYNHMSIEELRAIFGGAGPVRNVRPGPRRGASRMSVAFLVFDGPEEVQRALALSGTAKINGKFVYVNKFEIREDQKPGKFECDSTSPLSTA